MMVFLYKTILRRLLGLSLPTKYVEIVYPQFRKPTRENWAKIKGAPMSLEPPGPKDDLRILFFGDLMYMPGDQLPQPDSALVELFRSADLVIGNLESPIVYEKKNPKAFYYLKYLIAGKYLREFIETYAIDPRKCMVSIANNHIGDFGIEGLESTMNYLKKLGIVTTGRKNADNSLITKYTIGQTCIGVTAWTQYLNRNKNKFDEKSGIIRPKDIAEINWNKLKEQEKIDFVIATPHWDYEYHHYPHPETVDLAHRVIENGMDMIVGHHSHVLQAMEQIKGRYCHYSLGNLFGYDTKCWETRLGGLLEVHISRGGKLCGYNFHPVVQPLKKRETDEYRLIPLEKEEQTSQEQMNELLNLLFLPPKKG